jgi:hypothetical protein
MKKLLLLTLAIATLASIGYSQTTSPINRGGVIVYEKDGHGLVAAPTDLGPESYYGSTCRPWIDAEKGCEKLVLNGYSDWRLPTIKELNSLYKNRDKIGGFARGSYWSSTEDYHGWAWCQLFIDGKQYANMKVSGLYVRAVRAF